PGRHRRPIRSGGWITEADRMLDRRHLLDARPDGGRGWSPIRDAIRQVGGGPDRLPRDDDQATVELVDIDRDRVEALREREGHGLAVILERAPGAATASLEADPPKHQRLVVGPFEVFLRIDPTVDPDVGAAALGGETLRLGDRDLRRRCEQPGDPVARSEGSEDQPGQHEGEDARGRKEEGSHRRIIAGAAPRTANEAMARSGATALEDG